MDFLSDIGALSNDVLGLKSEYRFFFFLGGGYRDSDGWILVAESWLLETGCWIPVAESGYLAFSPPDIRGSGTPLDRTLTASSHATSRRRMPGCLPYLVHRA